MSATTTIAAPAETNIEAAERIKAEQPKPRRSPLKRSIKIADEKYGEQTYKVLASLGPDEATAAAKKEHEAFVERQEAKAEAAKPKADPKPAKAKAAPKGEWTLLGSFESIIAKKPDAGSKRAKIVADLATGANEEALVKIIENLHGLAGKDLAAGANALNAALSAHYARVS